MIYFTHLVRLSLSCKWVDKKPVMRVLLVIAKSIAIWYGYIIALSRMIGYFWIIKLSTNKPRPLPFARGTKATFSYWPLSLRLQSHRPEDTTNE